MTTNGNSVIHSAAKPGSGKLWQELSGLGAAEIVGAVVSTGVIAYADKVAPGATKAITKTISKIAVEPFLDQWEGGLKFFCHLKECQPDMTKSRQERAENIAHTITVFGAAFVPSLAAKLATRRGINEFCGHGDGHAWWKVWRPNAHDTRVFAWDEGIHIGSALAINTFGAKAGDKIIQGTSNVLQKVLGWPEKRAHDVATLVTVYELPNFIGLAAGSGAILHDHFKAQKAADLHKLVSSTSLSHVR